MTKNLYDNLFEFVEDCAVVAMIIQMEWRIARDNLTPDMITDESEISKDAREWLQAVKVYQ